MLLPFRRRCSWNRDNAQGGREGYQRRTAYCRYARIHEADFEDFLISVDNYHSTHSQENRELSELIYNRLNENGHIARREITQAYDPEKNLFLADRYIKGTCPKCKAEDQYGDNCEACGATYSPTDLINPVSAISGATPIEKESTHYFFKLPEFTQFLKEWTRSGAVQEEVANKLGEWLDSGLQEWDISRDAPYFGFEIPNAPGKYFYVWLDAPIGYMASFKNLCDRQGMDFDHYWNKDSGTELYHFIGKDIVNFHALFWPAMLSSAQFRTPTKICVHGFVTVNGKKMSKSRGTFINARCYLDHLNQSTCATTTPPSSPARWKISISTWKTSSRRSTVIWWARWSILPAAVPSLLPRAMTACSPPLSRTRNSGIRSVARQSYCRALREP